MFKVVTFQTSRWQKGGKARCRNKSAVPPHMGGHMEVQKECEVSDYSEAKRILLKAKRGYILGPQKGGVGVLFVWDRPKTEREVRTQFDVPQTSKAKLGYSAVPRMNSQVRLPRNFNKTGKV